MYSCQNLCRSNIEIYLNFFFQDDSELFYDLKQLLQTSPISHCPPELANHPDAMTNPRMGVMQGKRGKEDPQKLFK